MSERCERCKKGYGGAMPRDDVEWHGARPEPPAAGKAVLQVAKCTRCGTWLLDVWAAEREKPHGETHDVCMVSHGDARAALVDRVLTAIAAVSSQIRRKHLERLIESTHTFDPGELSAIADGAVPEASEVLRGLITHLLARTSDAPAIGDVRPKTRATANGPAAVGVRLPVDLGQGSRALLEPAGDGLALVRMRGDAVAWRVEIPTRSRDAYVARVQDDPSARLVVLSQRMEGSGSSLTLVDSDDGCVVRHVDVDVRVSAFDASALPGECVFVAGYQATVILRPDGTVAWRGAPGMAATAVPSGQTVVVTDAAWRLVSVELPSGLERWSMPIDRAAVLKGSGPGHVLLCASDVIARLAIDGGVPRLAWVVTGASPLPLAEGGVAVVRERWERGGRAVECVVFGADGRKRFTVPRTETTKVPTGEIGPGALVYAASSDVVVSVANHVTYALSVPERRPVLVTCEQDGAWIEFDGVVDRIDSRGKRIGRWRVGS